ncbi:LRR receptor kinase BAK1 [Sesamum angolense]|uniref:non-specific serine/threonine protein kinase n=2 Tax=Sesamum TaxID=4181 RepID=A0AAE1VZV2_9LAMI|nr:LRR receptor kinase BAK1 [Sesamum angolense]
MRNPPTLLSLSIDSALNNFSHISDISFLPEHILLELFVRTLRAGKLNEKILNMFVATGKEEILSFIEALNIQHIVLPVLPTRLKLPEAYDLNVYKVSDIECLVVSSMMLFLSLWPLFPVYCHGNVSTSLNSANYDAPTQALKPETRNSRKRMKAEVRNDGRHLEWNVCRGCLQNGSLGFPSSFLIILRYVDASLPPSPGDPGGCTVVKENLKDWSGFPVSSCCQNALLVFSHALAVQVKNDPSGNIFISQDQWSNCSGPFLTSAMCQFRPVALIISSMGESIAPLRLMISTDACLVWQFQNSELQQTDKSVAEALLAVFLVMIGLTAVITLIKYITRKQEKKPVMSKDISTTCSGLYRFSKAEIDNAINYGNEKKCLGRGSAGQVHVCLLGKRTHDQFCLSMYKGYCNMGFEGQDPEGLRFCSQLTNILLTHNMEPKLSDFGLARMLGMEESKVYTDVRGTIGYMDPEYMSNAKLTCASDIYSFGIVTLQLLSGQRVIELDLDARDQLTRKAKDVNMGKRPLTDFQDPRMKNVIDVDFESILQIAVLCVASSSTGRPTIDLVYEELEKALENTQREKMKREQSLLPTPPSKSQELTHV